MAGSIEANDRGYGSTEDVTSKPRRGIVVFAPGLSEVGGAARRAGLLTRGLAERGWRVRVIARAGTLRRFNLTRTDGFTLLEVPGFGRRRLGAALFMMLALPLGVIWGFRSRAFVAIQLFSQSWAAALCSLLMRKPYLVIGTISGASSEVDYVLSSVTAPIRRRLFGRASLMIAQTEEMASEMERLVPRGKVRILHNPVMFREQKPLDGTPKAAYAGRLSGFKDLPRLLEAWRMIANDRDGARLTLIGSGGEYESVEDELHATVDADDILRRTVTFTGWVPDVGPYLEGADVFVFPSTSEGMSNALIEACAYGRVVVASDISPNKEVMGDTYPLLFRVGDTGDLVKKLTLAFDEETVRAEAIAQIRTRIGRHSVESVVATLAGFLTEAVASADR